MARDPYGPIREWAAIRCDILEDARFARLSPEAKHAYLTLLLLAHKVGDDGELAIRGFRDQGKSEALTVRDFQGYIKLNPRTIARVLDELLVAGLLFLGENCVYKINESFAKPRGRFPISKRVRAIVLERDEFSCVHCGSNESLQIDHIHPVVLGGTSDLDNLQTLCRRCNLAKGPRPYAATRFGALFIEA